MPRISSFFASVETALVVKVDQFAALVVIEEEPVELNSFSALYSGGLCDAVSAMPPRARVAPMYI